MIIKNLKDYIDSINEGLIKTYPGDKVLLDILKSLKLMHLDITGEFINNKIKLTINKFNLIPLNQIENIFDHIDTFIVNRGGWFPSTMYINKLTNVNKSSKYNFNDIIRIHDEIDSIRIEYESKFDTEEKNIPDRLYHLTIKEYEKKINKFGLIPKVWGEDLPKLREKIINLWVNEGVLSKEEANKRVKEVICAALDDNLEVVAVCSGSPIYSDQLKDWFLYYRHFTSPKFRAQKLSIDLYYAAKEFFNKNRKVNDVELKGLYIVYESELYNKYYTKFINDHGVVLIGWTPDNNQIRVIFFDNAEINPKNLI